MRVYLLRLTLILAVLAGSAALSVPAYAQAGVFPLPAPLYILTADHAVLRIDPVGGGQTPISLPGQPVADFDIAPDGIWWVYRTADNGMIIVNQIGGQSGFVLEFDTYSAPVSGPAQTIAWSPDGSAIAYIVPEGVQIAYLGGGLYGEPVTGLVQGAWSELYWEGLDALIVSDSAGATTRITGGYERWTIAAASGIPARPQPNVPSYLAATGVMLDAQTAVPGTAGALAFDWGPLPLPTITGRALPADLTYIAPDATGIDQVWRLPRTGEPPQPVTRDVDPVIGYGFSPDGARIAYIAGDALLVAGADGASAQQLALLQIEVGAPQPRWSPDSAQIAYYDQRGVWIVPADGSAAPRLVAQSVPFTEGTSPADVRFYNDPRWSPEGTRLLLGVGFWEGAGLGVLDLISGTLAELQGPMSTAGLWTGDGRVLTWSWYQTYSQPALYVVDPAQPEADPVPLIANQPVWDVTRGADGAWYALVSPPATMGPQFLYVWRAASLSSAFSPLYPGLAGGFAQGGVLIAGDGQVLIAGLQPLVAEDYYSGRGALVLIDPGAGTSVRVQGAAPARQPVWLR